MKLEQHPLLAVRAIVSDEQGCILVLQRAQGSSGAGMWCLPGGKIDYGQTAEEAVRVEIFEETSLRVYESRFLFYLDGLPTSENPQHFITLFFHCRTMGKVVLNDESTAYLWISPQEIGSYSFAFRNDHALEKYLQVINDREC